MRQYDLRFCDSSKKKEFDIEATLEMTVVPAPAAQWAAWPSEGDGGAVHIDEAGTWSMAAGTPFTLALELLDAHGNKCAARAAAVHGAVRSSKMCGVACLCLIANMGKQIAVKPCMCSLHDSDDIVTAGVC